VDSLGGQSYPTALRGLGIVRRRKWSILLMAALVAGTAVGLSMRQAPLYQASSQVLLKYQNLASGLTGIQDLSTVYQDPARIAETQTQIAMSPAVAQRVVRKARIRGLTPGLFQSISSVTAEPSSDILDFTVTHGDPEIAQRLASVHARQFILHRLQLDTASLVAARNELTGRIEELRASEFRDSPLVAKLVENEQQLRTMEALQTANASLLRAAEGAFQIQPNPTRNAFLGIVLGLMFGVGLAFLREALDTRVLAAGEVSNRLGLALLARIPVPPRKLRSHNRLAMLADPLGAYAESFRMLRTNVEFMNLERGARSIMITSALEREGKSTTIANLAIAMARAGRNVALVDLDLRRPSLRRFFDLSSGQPGVTSVVLGNTSLSSALVEVLADPHKTHIDPKINPLAAEDNGNASRNGVLRVLPSGQLPPDPSAFITSSALSRMLAELEERFDLVLIDTPPLLSVGDTLALGSKVDAMIVVARLNVVRRPTIAELLRALQTCPTVALGCVVTGSELEQDYGYGGYYQRPYEYTQRTEDKAFV
jgi:succinoglycan biosynthesis transport protein ExoP